jgi:serine-type D-Ala-D-Ala carboxypeptidase (penicillin-binding protein 5/6)
MVEPVLSLLLMGLIPVWGTGNSTASVPAGITVAVPSALEQENMPFSRLSGSLTASGILVVDLDSGQTLYESGAERPRAMASLTKLMTALIIAEHHSLDESVRIPPGVDTLEGSKAKLEPGDDYELGDLLTALLVQSANDAAVSLAVHHSGSVEAFVEEMNRRAVSLGLKNTTYDNPIGLDGPAQRSTPRDLSWLAMYVLRRPEIAERMGMKAATIRSASGTTVTMYNTHEMLRSPASIVAGKTGTTDDAGQCLLSVVESGSRRYGVILLRSSDRYADMRRMLAILNG